MVQPKGGSCAFRVYLPHAGSVELVGDFTSWEGGAVPMRRDAEGFWCCDLAVPDGEHRFSYVVDGMFWMPDYAAHGLERNALGRWVSRLEVAGRARPSGSAPAGRWVSELQADQGGVGAAPLPFTASASNEPAPGRWTPAAGAGQEDLRGPGRGSRFRQHST